MPLPTHAHTLLVTQDTLPAGEWQVGDRVDVWDDGGWWETWVMEKGPQEGHVTLAGVAQRPIHRDALRCTVVWDGQSFSRGGVDHPA